MNSEHLTYLKHLEPEHNIHRGVLAEASQLVLQEVKGLAVPTLQQDTSLQEAGQGRSVPVG